jgi:outer membrane protein
MKKITNAALVLATCLTASNAQADTIYGIYAGVQGWNMDADGSFGQARNGVNSTASFNFDKESQNSYYLAIEHPIPLIPNFKVKRNTMETNGDTTLTGTFVFGDETFSTTSQLSTIVDLSNTDYILYYELLDNDLVTIDFGINAKNVDGVLDVVNKNDATQTARETFDGFVPMLYGNVELGLPFTGLGVFAEGSLLSVGDHTLYDYEAGIGYTFIDNVAVDLTLQLGYRAVKLELDDLDDINSNLDFDGVFVGLEIHF